MNRRQLISIGIAAAPLVFQARAWAAPQAGGARFLLVFLRGGYDAANVLIPTRNDFYLESRPHIAVASPNPNDANAALPLDSHWSMHPALGATLTPLWRARQLAFVPFAGAEDMSRSHFETQDTIELGQPLGGQRDLQSGFLNRLIGVLAAPKPIAFTEQLPLVLRGATLVPNQPISAVGGARVSPEETRLIERMYTKDAFAPEVNEGFAVAHEAYAAVAGEMTAASRGAVAPKGFELAARRVGRLMAQDFNLGFIDVGGWDTHVNQGGATGYLADRLSELGRGLAAIPDEMGPAWSDTVVVVISEFGRTFRENGARGTDHGHGSCYWVLGGGVKGGAIVGPQVALSPETLNQERDLPVLTNYRSLLGGVFARLYGLNQAQLRQVFPDTSAVNLRLI